MLEMGERREDFDEAEFRRSIGLIVAEAAQVRVGDLKMGRALIEVARVAGDTGVRIPPNFRCWARRS